MEYVWGQSIRWIPGYEGRYAATIDGKIASYCLGQRSKGRPAFLKQRLNSCNGRSYFVVDLFVNGKTKIRKVHQLVLEAFKGPRPLGMVACHKDDNPVNNHADNLEWDTQCKNSRMRCSNKLDEQKVRRIRFLRFHEGWTPQEIADHFGINLATAYKVLSGKIWAGVR